MALVSKNLHRGKKKIPESRGLFNAVEKGGTRARGWTLKPNKFKLEIKHIILIVRMNNHWNKLLFWLEPIPWSFSKRPPPPCLPERGKSETSNKSTMTFVC